MWIHSLWCFIPGNADGLASELEGVFNAGTADKRYGGVIFQRRDSFTERCENDEWSSGPVSDRETVEVSALYVVNPETIGMPAAGGRTLVGIAGPRPASNQALASRLAANYRATAVLPVLSKRNVLELAGFRVYEARKESDARELSVTYLDAEQKEVLDEWPDGTEFDAVTLNWRGYLLTTFANGQLWLDGLPLETVPEAVGFLGAQLWPEGLAANVVH